MGALLVAVGAITATAGACGGTSGGNKNENPEPTTVARKYAMALKAHHDAAACTYVTPGKQKTCEHGLAKTNMTVTNFKTRGQSVHDTRALVATTGKLCNDGTKGCTVYDGTNNGLPHGSTTFNQAYAAADHTANQTGVVVLTKISGRWYVRFT